MPIPANFFDHLIAPPPKLLAGHFTSSNSNKNATAVWSWVKEVSPADVYCYLGARFGAPNGLQNILRNDDSDNLIHWEWHLEDQNSGNSIQFFGMNFRTEIVLVGNLDIEPSDKHQLAIMLKASFSPYSAKMSAVRRSLESWTEFVNPYQRLRRSIEKLLKDIESLDLRPETLNNLDPSNPAEFEEQWNTAASNYSRAIGLCFGIRSMLPVMAEAYINLLYFLLLHEDLKADDRLRENMIRQPIDVRIRSMHINCRGFAKPVDYAAPECKSFHSLVNERNDLLHGNVVLEKLKFNEVYFHGRVPVFKEYRSMWERAFGVEIEAVGLNHLYSEVKTVNEFLIYLTSCLDPTVGTQVEVISKKRDLGWNKLNGHVGILFPDRLVDMLPIFGDRR